MKFRALRLSSGNSSRTAAPKERPATLLAETPPEEFFTMSQAKKRRIEVEEVDDVSIVEFVDKRILDEQNIQLIGDQLFELVDDLGKKKLLLNFANVEYLSSAALGKLMTLNKKVKAAGGELRLANIKAEIKEVFSITKLDKMLKIFDSEKTALDGF
jgi:anti-sigma B factor antagonist